MHSNLNVFRGYILDKIVVCNVQFFSILSNFLSFSSNFLLKILLSEEKFNSTFGKVILCFTYSCQILKKSKWLMFEKSFNRNIYLRVDILLEVAINVPDAETFFNDFKQIDLDIWDKSYLINHEITCLRCTVLVMDLGTDKFSAKEIMQ